MIKVKDKSNLFRDPSSNAIINKDKQAATLYREAKQKRLQEQKRLDSLEEKLDRVESLLTQLIEK